MVGGVIDGCGVRGVMSEGQQLNICKSQVSRHMTLMEGRVSRHLARLVRVQLHC